MSTHLPPLPRDIGTVNWIGLWTLYQREVYRFLKVYTQTIAAPVVTTLLFYAVFALALGGVVRMAGSVPFLVFLGPGLIVMAMAQNAFANTSSSVVIGSTGPETLRTELTMSTKLCHARSRSVGVCRRAYRTRDRSTPFSP